VSDEPQDQNEIVALARAAKERSDAAAAAVREGARSWPVKRIGLGVGSAALAAALLYARRERRRK
jgi:hypothetical protein